ncbi:MAG TPA: prepilin-type N-terminal cleavage/methylation domain-containing protein [bacterium]|nr:prepilin-type N-terminal cleavage/methylation domain-containing protein [bacterium]
MRTIRHYWQSERGMTLIELLIACFLTFLVAGAAMEFYISQHKTWLVENDVAAVQQNVRASLDEIAGALRMGGYQLKSHPAYTLGADSLTIYQRDDATAEVDTTLYFVATDDQAQTNLYRQFKGETPEVLAENVESFALTRLGPNLIDISLTARAPKPDSALIAGDGYRRRTFETQVRLRNL